jgi:hypothetical protein
LHCVAAKTTTRVSATATLHVARALLSNAA